MSEIEKFTVGTALIAKAVGPLGDREAQAEEYLLANTLYVLKVDVHLTSANTENYWRNLRLRVVFEGEKDEEVTRKADLLTFVDSGQNRVELAAPEYQFREGEEETKTISFKAKFKLDNVQMDLTKMFFAFGVYAEYVPTQCNWFGGLAQPATVFVNEFRRLINEPPVFGNIMQNMKKPRAA